MKRNSQSNRAYWDSLELIASNVELIVSDGPQPWREGDGLVQYPSTQRPRSRLAAALAGDINDPLGSFNIFAYSRPGTPEKLHDAIVAILPGADRLGESRQERITALTARLPELESYRWLRSLPAYQEAVTAVKRAGKTKGGKFASDVAEFALLRVLIGPLHMFELAQERPSVMAKPARGDVEAALKAAQLLESFLAAHGGLYAAGLMDVMAVQGLHKIGDSLRAMVRASSKAPQDKESARQILYLDELTTNMHREFGSYYVPALLALAAIVDYRPDSSNLYARVKKITKTRGSQSSIYC